MRNVFRERDRKVKEMLELCKTFPLLDGRAVQAIWRTDLPVSNSFGWNADSAVKLCKRASLHTRLAMILLT